MLHDPVKIIVDTDMAKKYEYVRIKGRKTRLEKIIGELLIAKPLKKSEVSPESLK